MNWVTLIDFDEVLRIHPLLKSLSFEKRKLVYQLAQRDVAESVAEERILNDNSTVKRGKVFPNRTRSSAGLLWMERIPNSTFSYLELEALMDDKPYVDNLDKDTRRFIYDYVAQIIARKLDGYPVDNFKSDSTQSQSEHLREVFLSFTLRKPHIHILDVLGELTSAFSLKTEGIPSERFKADTQLSFGFKQPVFPRQKQELYSSFSLDSHYGFNYKIAVNEEAIKTSFMLKDYATTGRREIPSKVTGLSASTNEVVKATEGSTSTLEAINLAWDEAAGAKGYIVYRDDGAAGSFKLLSTITVDKPAFTDSGLASGTWKYKVSAYNRYGEGETSTEVSVVIT